MLRGGAPLCLRSTRAVCSRPVFARLASSASSRLSFHTKTNSIRSLLSQPTGTSALSPHAPFSTLRTLQSIIPPSLLAKAPKGFKNFFPDEEGDVKEDDSEADKKGKSQKKESKATDSKSETKSETKAKSEGDKAGSGKKENEWGGKKKKKKKKKDEDQTPSMMETAAKLGLIAAFLIPFLLNNNKAAGSEITYQEFKQKYLEGGQVEILTIVNKKRVNVVMKGDKEPKYYFFIGSVDSFERQLEDIQFELNFLPRNFIPVKYTTETNFSQVLFDHLPEILTIAFVGFVIFQVMKGMGGLPGAGGGGKGGKNIFSIGKSQHQKIDPEESTNVTFDDVAGLDEAKVEVMEFVKFLKNPDRFTKLGAKIPKGALLVGPPGTGKTLLAKATAGEASVPFYSISGSDFIEMFVGVGPSRVRDLFKEAREDAPCIIFIDEIDAVGRSRSKGGMSGGNDERENTLNQMLVEMDGFQTAEGVVVLAGTNRADILDKALLRPGRFDRQIQIDKPDIKGRAQIFKVHLAKITVNRDLDDIANRMAALTPGMAGADIANVCNEGALIAARNKKDAVELSDFEQAVDRVIGGLEKKNQVLNQAERKLVAYHEAGHAVVGWFLDHCDPLLKVTIVPRSKGALGFAQYLPSELSLYQTEQLTDMMCMALGGRAAEQTFFGKISTGASDDLKRVTKIAHGQVAVYGMGSIGHLNYQPDPNDQQFTKPYSEATAAKIDTEVSEMISANYARTLAMVEQYKDKVEALAQKLLEVETVNHDTITELLGPRPVQTDSYRDYMAAQDELKKELAEKEAKEKAAAAEQEEEDKAARAATAEAAAEVATDGDGAAGEAKQDEVKEEEAKEEEDEVKEEEAKEEEKEEEAKEEVKEEEAKEEKPSK